MPDPKQGPPTLRECREVLRVLHSFYSHNVVDQQHLENVGHSKNILDRLTDEALERDEKRTAALMEFFRYTDYMIGKHKIARKDGGDFCIEFAEGESALTVLFDLALHVETCRQAGVDALTPAPKEEGKQ